jgi:hypothetical protein
MKQHHQQHHQQRANPSDIATIYVKIATKE